MAQGCSLNPQPTSNLEHKIFSISIAIRRSATIDDLVDVVEAKNRCSAFVIYALREIDATLFEGLDLLCRIPDVCFITSEHSCGKRSDDICLKLEIFGPKIADYH